MRHIPTLSLSGIFLLALVLILLPVVTTAQELDPNPEEPAPGVRSARQEAELQEEPTGFGYVLGSGNLVLSTDSAAVLCPASGFILLHPHHLAEALTAFEATDNGDGTWTLPDPETRKQLVLKTQVADAIFDDGRGGANAEELKKLASLPLVNVQNVVLSPWFWPRCWRLRLHHRCGTLGTCPNSGQCIGGTKYTQVRKYLECTFDPWNVCLEFLSPVCRVTRYTCRDCTGPVIFRRNLNRFVCAVF